MRAVLVILVFAVLGDVTGLAQAQEGEVRFERWYRVERDGHPIGWNSYIERVDGDRVVTESVYADHVLILGEERRYETRGVVIEDSGGRVLSKSISVNGVPVSLDDAIRPHEFQPADFDQTLGPSAAARFIASRLKAGADQLSVWRVNPLGFDRVRPLRLTGISACSKQIGDRQIDGYCGEEIPGMRVMLCERGYLIGYEFVQGARHYVFRATSKAIATAPHEPIETVEDSVVLAFMGSGYVKNWSDCGFLITLRSGRPIAEPPAIGAYRFASKEGGLVVTRRPGPIEDPGPDERALALRETRLMNYGRLADAPDLVDSLSAYERALILKRLVHTRLATKSYRVRLGDAFTAWEGREGDCTEHAVLLAAMLRREGIPARVVGGLIRTNDTDDFLIQHLWVQALVETYDGLTWHDLDATLDPERAASDRIALGATGVTDDSVEDLVRRLGSMNGLLCVEALAPE